MVKLQKKNIHVSKMSFVLSNYNHETLIKVCASGILQHFCWSFRPLHSLVRTLKNSTSRGESIFTARRYIIANQVLLLSSFGKKGTYTLKCVCLAMCCGWTILNLMKGDNCKTQVLKLRKIFWKFTENENCISCLLSLLHA